MSKQQKQANTTNFNVGCLIVAILYFMIPTFLNQCDSTSSTSNSTSSYSGNNMNLIEWEVAAVNDDSGSPRKSSLSKAKRLLSSIEQNTSNSKQQIADMSVMGWEDLNDMGISIGLLDLMSQVDQFIKG